MTATSIDTKLAGCADEKLAAIVLHLAELQSGATPNTRIPMTQQPHPPSARRSDDAELESLEALVGAVKIQYTPHESWGQSLQDLAGIPSRQAREQETWTDSQQSFVAGNRRVSH